MAVTSIMSTEAEINQKLGANVNTNFTDAMKTAAGLQGESVINSITRFNWSDWFAGSPNADVKGILSDFVSSFVALQAIIYDMSGFTSRYEAETMLDVLRDGMMRNISLLRDKKTKEFITGEDT